MEIVRLKPGEWQAYKELRLAALKNDPQAFSSTYADQVQFPDSFWQGRLQDAAEGGKSRLLFAREGERLVGMVGAFLDSKDTAGVISLYVTPEGRGKGIARGLITTILSEIREIPSVKKVILAVNARQEAAVHLYTNLGFKIVGQEESIMGDGNIYTEYQMEKVFT